MEHIELVHESTLQQVHDHVGELLVGQTSIRRELSAVQKSIAHLREAIVDQQPLQAARSLTPQPLRGSAPSNLRSVGSEAGEGLPVTGRASTVRMDEAYSVVTWHLSSSTAPGGARTSTAESTMSTGPIAATTHALDALSRRSMSMNSLHVRSVAISAHSSLPLSWPANVKARGTIAKISDECAAAKVLAEATRQRGAAQLLAAQSASKVGQSFLDSSLEGGLSCCSLLVIHPTSWLRLSFDLVSLAVLLFDLLVTPFMMAFDLQDTRFYFNGSIVTLAFWTLSILVNFRLAFYRHGEVEMRAASIAWHYCSSWFLPDLFLVITDWFSMLVLVLDAATVRYSAAVTLLRFSKAGRMLRLLGIFRMARFTGVLVRLADRCMSKTVKTMIETLGFIVVLLWVNHLVSCAWVALGRQSATDTGLHWIDAPILPADAVISTTYRDSSNFYIYASALHWSLTQMSPASMQVHALNTSERFFSVLCVILGILCSGSIVSTLTAKMMQVMMANKQHAERLNGLRTLLQQKHVSRSLAMNVQKMVQDRLSARKPVTMKDIPALDLLSLALRAKLQDELCRPHLMGHAVMHMFMQMDASTMQAICTTAIDFVVMQTEDDLFLAATDSSSAYLIVGGSMLYIQEPAYAMVSEREETLVPAGSWLCEAGLWTEWSHVGNLQARKVTEVMSLLAAKLVTVVDRHPVVKIVAAEYCRIYTTRLANAVPPLSSWPSDLHVPYTEYGDLVLSMSPEARCIIGLASLDGYKCTMQSRFFWRRAAESLRREVLKGKCTLVCSNFDSVGAIEMVFGQVAMHLEDTQGRVLAQLGLWDVQAAKAVAMPMLPTVDLEPGETTTTGLNKLLQSAICIFADNLEVTHAQQEEVKVEWARYGIPKRSFCTLHYARLTGYVDVPVSVTPRVRPSARHAPIFHQTKRSQSHEESKYVDELLHAPGVFLLMGSEEEEPHIFAWLNPESVEFWKGIAGRAQLQAILDQVAVLPEHIALAKASADEAMKLLGDIDPGFQLPMRASSRVRRTRLSKSMDFASDLGSEDRGSDGRSSDDDARIVVPMKQLSILAGEGLVVDGADQDTATGNNGIAFECHDRTEGSATHGDLTWSLEL